MGHAKIRRLSTVVALAILSTLPGQFVTATPATAATPTADWKQWRYDETHAGFNAGEVILGPSNLQYLTLYSQAGRNVLPLYNNGRVVSCDIGQCFEVTVLAPKGHPVLHTWGKEDAYIGIGDGRMFQTRLPGNQSVVDVVDLRTGRLVGSVPVPGGTVGPPVYHSGRVFVAGSLGHLVAFDSQTVTVDWDSAKADGLGVTYTSAPTVAYNRVYTSACDQLLAVKEDTGTLRWSAPLPGSADGHCGGLPAAANQRVYVATSALTAFDYLTGAQRWSVAGSGQLSDPAVAYQRVYTVSPDAGTISAYATRDGRLLWSAPTIGTGPPTVANGLVWVAGPTGMQAFDAYYGGLVRTFDGDFAGAPVISHGLLMIECPAQPLAEFCLYALPGAVPGT